MKKVMKNKRILGIIAVGLLAVFVAASGVIASPPVGLNGPPPPVASKITYQGQLTDDAGNPLSGSYDMEFQFWTAPTGGSQAGSTIAKSGVEVVNGLFSVKLEVDQSDFNGQGLWLQMRVRPSGGSWDDWMTPRQQILPVPYALSLKPGAIIDGDTFYGLSSITTGSYGLRGESSSPSMGAGVKGVNTGGVGDGIHAVSDGRAGIMALGEGASTYGGYFISDNRIGVYGTTSSDDTDIPAIKGENTGHGYGVLGIGSWYDSIGVYGQSGFGTGVRGEGETGVWGESSLGPGVVGKGVVGVQGMSDIGDGVYGRSTSSDGHGGYFVNTADSDGTGIYGEGAIYGMHGKATISSWEGDFPPPIYGVYGETVDLPGFGYGVYGNANTGVYGYGTTNDGVVGYAAAEGSWITRGVVGHTRSTNALSAGVYGNAESSGGGHGVYAKSAGGAYAGAALLAENTNTTNGIAMWGKVKGDDSTMVLEQNAGAGDFIRAFQTDPSNLRFAVDVNGNVYADGPYSTPAADFAEMLPAVEGLEPGDVLVVGPDGKLAGSTQPYASNVVGVYSTNPGFVGGSSDDDDQTGKVPLTVLGVVPVKANAENGSIAPGDLLTSAFMPGYAMKATDLKVGTIIGKALESLDEGTGIIRMLVMLQ